MQMSLRSIVYWLEPLSLLTGLSLTTPEASMPTKCHAVYNAMMAYNSSSSQAVSIDSRHLPGWVRQHAMLGQLCISCRSKSLPVLSSAARLSSSVLYLLTL